MNRKIIIAVGILAVCLFACVMVYHFTSENHEEYSIDYGYLYDGFYLDINDEDYMLTRYTKNDGTSGLLSFTSTGDTRSVKMYEDKEHTKEIANKLPVKQIIRAGNYSVIEFLGIGSGSVTDIDNFVKAYSKLHPELTGIHPIPTFWTWAQYYWLDNDTGQLWYLPISSAIYDFDRKEFVDSYGTGSIIGYSYDYFYYRQFDGIFKMRFVDGVVENEKLFNSEFALSPTGVTKNDIIITSDILFLPDGNRITVPQDYEILNGMLCTNVDYMTVYDYDKKTQLKDYYPISADVMEADGSFTHHEYTLSESEAIGEQKAYKNRLYSRIFDLVNHRCYLDANIINYTELIQDGEDYYVSVQKMDIGNVVDKYHNIYVVSEESSLFLYNILSGKKTLVSDDVYKINSRSAYSNALTYSDNQFIKHTVYMLPDGTFSQENNADYKYVYVW